MMGIRATGTKAMCIMAAIALVFGVLLVGGTIMPPRAEALEIAAYDGDIYDVNEYIKENFQKAKPVTTNLKKMGVKFDLKKNKKVKIYDRIDSCNASGSKTKAIKQPYTVTVKDFRIGKAKKKGYKKATFKVVWSSKWRPSEKQKKAIWNMLNNNGGLKIFAETWDCFVDYKTGENLEVKNAYGVKVKVKSGKASRSKTYRRSDGSWFYLVTGFTKKFTVTYPASYKNLCFGVGGGVVTPFSDEWQMAADMKFFKKSSTDYCYTGTSYFKKGKKNSHFMRIK